MGNGESKGVIAEAPNMALAKPTSPRLVLADGTIGTGGTDVPTSIKERGSGSGGGGGVDGATSGGGTAEGGLESSKRSSRRSPRGGEGSGGGSARTSPKQGGGGGGSPLGNGSGRRSADMHDGVIADDDGGGVDNDVNDDDEDEREDYLDKRSRIDSVIREERIPINLAMADLMSYLQSVAQNSAYLPNTRRDDPEIGRTVSNITAEEYADMSEAFVPCDFRMIAGSFTKYGKVWDLPTSEEYIPSDGAQEPGKSYGGACTNSMLKVLYDNESPADEVHSMLRLNNNPSDLFREDSTDAGSYCVPSHSMQSTSFASVDIGNIASPCQMSWADLLRKMKLEMQSIGHVQVPIITSSRLLDVHQPFSLVPPDFDVTKNKKRSLFIGCNYRTLPEDARLKAAHDDVKSMQDFIVNIHGFPKDSKHMTVLLDDGDLGNNGSGRGRKHRGSGKHHHPSPTYNNIVEACKRLSEKSQPGDAVFVHFSGHGCRVMDAPIDDEVDSYDEAIIPSDFETSGVVRDTLIFKTLIAPMKKGVTVTCVFDACDTGVVLDLPYRWSSSSKDDSHSSDKLQDSQMTMNNDFSFVRFLKVIKTMYDGSTFTQLGRTVRTAINHKSPGMGTRYDDDDDDDSADDNSLSDSSLMTADRVNDRQVRRNRKKNGGKENLSFFANAGNLLANNVLTACHSPVNAIGSVSNNMSNVSELEGSPSGGGGGRKGDRNNPVSPGNAGKALQKDANLQNIIQQMLNCNVPLLSDDDNSAKRHSSVRRRLHRNDIDDEDTFGDDTFGEDDESDDGGSLTSRSRGESQSPRRPIRRKQV